MEADVGTAGLAAVWAPREHPRIDLGRHGEEGSLRHDGTRLIVRVFAGWDFEEDEVQRPSW